MLTPGGYAEAVCRGTTTIFTDPHELANVSGGRGRALPGGQPRPAGALHRAGRRACRRSPGSSCRADLYGDEVREMMTWPEVGGLAEVMEHASARPRIVTSAPAWPKQARTATGRTKWCRSEGHRGR